MSTPPTETDTGAAPAATEPLVTNTADLEQVFGLIRASVGETTLSGAKAVSQKYRQMFDDLNEAVSRSEETQSMLFNFAARFRPMNDRAFEYVLKLKFFARHMRDDKIPTIQDSLDDDDFETLTEVVQEIADLFKPIVKCFDEVVAGYSALQDEATQLDLTAQQQIRESQRQVQTADRAQRLGAAAVMGSLTEAAGVGVVAAAGSLPAALAPVGLLTGAAGVLVIGSVAVFAGKEAKKTHQQIVEDMRKLDMVMQDIVVTVEKHGKELRQISAALESLAGNTDTLSKRVHDGRTKKEEGKKLKAQKNGAARQLQAMTTDCNSLEENCDQYLETEQAGQTRIWNLLQS